MGSTSEQWDLIVDLFSPQADQSPAQRSTPDDWWGVVDPQHRGAVAWPAA